MRAATTTRKTATTTTRAAKMFGRFSNFLNQAVEALAPSQSNLDDFEFHWRATTGYFLENRDAKAPLHSTAIPGVERERESESESESETNRQR